MTYYNDYLSFFLTLNKNVLVTTEMVLNVDKIQKDSF